MQERMAIHIRGAVQGVGFRPFVYRLAHEMGLAGWVSNSAQGVHIEAQGEAALLLCFVERIQREAPPHARITHLETAWRPPMHEVDFTIHHSDTHGAKSVLLLPDLAICPDCLRDILDPANRRYRYPFTNCTHCGPRYSIIAALPYDRASTSMSRFAMCPDCQREYDNPADRRFHAQPNACPRCGPQLFLWDAQGRALAERDDALLWAAEALRRGQIVACKGLGGFHLLVDARSESAVQRLRARKRRPHKPLATMFPSLEAVKAACVVSEPEAQVLGSAAAPIVLLRLKPGAQVAASVAPGSPHLGVMLPYTPLHVLLLRALGFPLVATSGNLSDEPICTDERDALARLGGIADLLLAHDRPILRPVDDSVVQVINGEAQVLRRARGYAPLSLELDAPTSPALAVGAHLKNTIAVSSGAQMFLSQHIGDLDNARTFDVFASTLADLQRMYEVQPAAIAHDLHPDYRSTQYALEQPLEACAVQHHYAHGLACMLDNGLTGSALAVVWDGTGCGTDGTIWGGEWLRIDEAGFTRAAYLRPFPLPGGEKAVREPRRSALGLLYALEGDTVFSAALPPVTAFSKEEQRILKAMLRSQLNTPQTSSMGRLFDGVAALLGRCQVTSFEGQAAMQVEALASSEALAYGAETEMAYPFALDGPQVDWRPMLRAILDDIAARIPPEDIAGRFHNTLAEMLLMIAHQVGEPRVLLTGGCFQNRRLTERAIARLRAEGFTPYCHHQVPPNDGGVAVGQMAALIRQKQREENVLCV